MHEAKVDIYLERIQQPLTSEELKKEIKNKIFTQAIVFTKQAGNGPSRRLSKAQKMQKDFEVSSILFYSTRMGKK